MSHVPIIFHGYSSHTISYQKVLANNKYKSKPFFSPRNSYVNYSKAKQINTTDDALLIYCDKYIPSHNNLQSLSKARQTTLYKTLVSPKYPIKITQHPHIEICHTSRPEIKTISPHNITLSPNEKKKRKIKISEFHKYFNNITTGNKLKCGVDMSKQIPRKSIPFRLYGPQYEFDDPHKLRKSVDKEFDAVHTTINLKEIKDIKIEHRAQRLQAQHILRHAEENNGDIIY